MADLERTIVNPHPPIGAYSQAVRVRANELVFIAGQIAVGADGNFVGTDDVAAQTRQVYENIGKVLEGVGASFSNVVEFTTYLVGRESFEPYAQARSELFPTLFPDGDYPANTLLIISGLARPELLVEIKAVAALG